MNTCLNVRNYIKFVCSTIHNYYLVYNKYYINTLYIKSNSYILFMGSLDTQILCNYINIQIINKEKINKEGRYMDNEQQRKRGDELKKYIHAF